MTIRSMIRVGVGSARHWHSRWRRVTAMLLAAMMAALPASVFPLAGTAAAYTPEFSITTAPESVTADELASVLLGPGVELAGTATANGAPSPDTGAHQAYGTFSGADDALGLSDGLIISANSTVDSFNGSAPTGTASDNVRDDAALDAVLRAQPDLCHSPTARCVYNATDLAFSVVPEADFLKFEYVLAVTESGTYNHGNGTWSGEMFSYPDGFALFVDGDTVESNCAVVPTTGDYLTMRNAGIVAPQGSIPANRAAAVASSAPQVFAYSAGSSGDWPISFLTVPLTCTVDVSAHHAAHTPVPIRIVIADANDKNYSPAVFLKGGSVRFRDSETGTEPPVWVDDTLPTQLAAGQHFSDQVIASGEPQPTYTVTAGALPAGVTLNAATGAVSGAPTTPGPFTATITADNGVGDPISTVFAGDVVAAAAWVDDTLVDQLRVGVPYSDSVAAAGWPAATYAVAVGALPAGVALNATTGEVSGTPTVPGPFSATIAASNGTGEPVYTVFSGEVTAAPEWVTSTLDPFVVGEPYEHTLVASGWPGPTYAVTSGAFPDGITFDLDTGVVSGTPTAPGSFTVTIAASNGVGDPVSVTHTGEVFEAPAWVRDTLAPFTLGVPFTDTVEVAGYPPASFAITGGALPDGVTLDPDTGVVSGTPTAVGPYSVTITAHNGVGVPITATITGEVGSSPVWVDDSVGQFIVGVPFADTLTAEGWPAPSYTISAGSLPAGITLDTATGAVSGTPAAPGPFEVTITASNGFGDPVSTTITGEVAQVPAWVDDTLSSTFEVGVPYSDSVEASGHPVPDYDITAGALPDGITLDTVTGVVSGTPVAGGPYAFTITALNGFGDPVSVTVTGEVEQAPLWVGDSLAPSTIGEPYSDTLVAESWPAPTYAVTAGSLPAGLTLDTSTGEVSGTPTVSGPFSVTIVADNGVGDPAVTTIDGDVFQAPAWVDDTLAPFTVDEPYADALVASGWPTPTYTVTDGELPAGVTIDTATGVLSGVPSGTGSYSFSVTAENSQGSVRASFSSSMQHPPEWETVSLGSLVVGVPYSGFITAAGFPAPTHAVTEGALPAGIELEEATGELSGTPTTQGPFHFTITASNGVGSTVFMTVEGDVLAGSSQNDDHVPPTHRDTPPLGPDIADRDVVAPVSDADHHSPRRSRLPETGADAVRFVEFAGMLALLGAALELVRRGVRTCRVR